MKKQNLLVLAVAIAGALAPVAQADTFLSYLAPSSNTTVSFDGTTLTGTAIPVDLFYLDPISGAPSTATLNFSATAVAGSAVEPFPTFAPGLFAVSMEDISFSITSGLINILSGTATTGELIGGGAGYALSAPNPGGGVAFTSDIEGLMTDLSFQISTGPPDSTASVSGGTLSSFQTTAGPGAFVGTASPVPEPSSIALLGTGLLTLAGAARRKFAA